MKKLVAVYRNGLILHKNIQVKCRNIMHKIQTLTDGSQETTTRQIMRIGVENIIKVWESTKRLPQQM
jgi:hypothetical protein